MYFHSAQFLIFVLIAWSLYWAVHRNHRARVAVLLIASLIFYAAFSPFPILIFAWCALVDWLVARGMEATTVQRTHKVLLAVSVISNLAILCVFKYADLFYRTTSELLAHVGIAVRYEPTGLLLPVGLSFVVFQAISLTVDIYRGELRGYHSYWEHLLFLLFFPQIVSGPITRAEFTLKKFKEVPKLTQDEGAAALYRIAIGLAKKLLIADVLANQIVDRVFEHPAIYTSAECTIAAIAYTFQIYCDFSAYSDMAIGIARLFGFRYPENFKKPYLAKNLQEFWNRWHLSLSTWLRDYLYIPLGGNRHGAVREMINVQIVMLLGGLWHGADWRFALWGIIHGAGLALTKLYWWIRGGKPKTHSLPGVAIGMLATFTVVVLTRVFFRAKDIGHAVEFFKQMAERTIGFENVSELAWIGLAAAVATHFIPKSIYDWTNIQFVRAPVYARATFLVLLVLALRQVSTLEVRPYIYAQF
ncbi:MAG: MBOAT family O-acyltransferase [Myxococcaceae bacterium]